MTPPIVTLVARARGHSRAPGARKLMRVVVRFAPDDVARVDALRSTFKASRAALLRAFCVVGLTLAEEQTAAPAAPEGGAP